MKTSRLAPIAFAALASIVAGCGGADNSPLTKQEFASKADEICKGANGRFSQVTADLQKKLRADPSQAQAAAEDSLKQLAPLVKDTVDKIGELKPPAEMQAKLETYVKEANAAADQVAADPAKYARASGDSASPFPKLTVLSQELGLDNCGPGA